MKVLNINTTHEAENYPYGRKRTSAFFRVEFKIGKGFRNVFQTRVPDSTHMNAPKNGTYHGLCFNAIEAETGHIKQYSMQHYDYDGILKMAKFISLHWDDLQLTPDMIKSIAAGMQQVTNGYYAWSNAKPEFLELITPTRLQIKKCFDEAANHFNEITIPIAALNELSDKHPVKFTVTTYG